MTARFRHMTYREAHCTIIVFSRVILRSSRSAASPHLSRSDGIEPLYSKENAAQLELRVHFGTLPATFASW